MESLVAHGGELPRNLAGKYNKGSWRCCERNWIAE